MLEKLLAKLGYCKQNTICQTNNNKSEINNLIKKLAQKEQTIIDLKEDLLTVKTLHAIELKRTKNLLITTYKQLSRRNHQLDRLSCITKKLWKYRKEELEIEKLAQKDLETREINKLFDSKIFTKSTQVI